MERGRYEAAVTAFREAGLGTVAETDHLSGDGRGKRHGTMEAEMSPATAESVIVAWLRVAVATGAFISIDTQPWNGDVRLSMYVLRDLTDEERAAMHAVRRVA